MELPIADCRLDENGLRLQRDRYRKLGHSAEAIERGEATLAVRFGPGLDRDLLEETIAIEADCCPFFRFDYLPGERLLRIGVERADQVAALGALAYALGEDGTTAPKTSVPSPPAPGPAPAPTR